jgi:hypothetical protein
MEIERGEKEDGNRERWKRKEGENNLLDEWRERRPHLTIQGWIV